MSRSFHLKVKKPTIFTEAKYLAQTQVCSYVGKLCHYWDNILDSHNLKVRFVWLMVPVWGWLAPRQRDIMVEVYDRSKLLS